MATREQLIDALKRADAAGDADAARAIARRIREMEQGVPELLKRPAEKPRAQRMAEAQESERQRLQQELLSEMSGADRFLAGVGRGMYTVGRGLGLADEPDETVKRADKALLDSGFAAQAGNIIGQAAPFVPLLPLSGAGLTAGGSTLIPAATTTAARVGLGAGIGALEGGILAKGEGGDAGEIVSGAGIGGAIGGGAEILFPYVGRIGNRLLRALGKESGGPILTAAGTPTKQFQQALDDAGMTFDDIVNFATQANRQGLDPDQAARLAAFQALDDRLIPTKAQITRDPTTFQAQEELAKTTGKVRAALEQQDAILSSRFSNEIAKTLGDSSSRGASVAEAILGKATKLDEEIGQLYKAAREASGTAKNIKPIALGEKLRRVAPSNTRAGGAVEAVVGELQQRGIMDDQMRVVGRVGVNTMEEMRAFINSLHDKQNPFGNAILREMKDALDDDVFKQTGDDLFKQARSAKAAFEKELNQAKLSKFDARDKHIVRDILENKIDPDQIVDKVVLGKSWRPDDLSSLKKYVTTAEDGKKAWDDLRASVLDTIKSKALIGPEDAQGFQRMSADKLSRALNQIGEKKLNVLFDEKEIDFLNKLSTVLKLREPVRATAMGKGPSAQAIKELTDAATKGVPLIGEFLENLKIGKANRVLARGAPAQAPKTISPLLEGGQRAAAAGAIASQIKEEETE